MDDASPDDLRPDPPARFARQRFGLHFCDPAVERGFREWQWRELRRSVVLGMNGSILAWSLGLLGQLLLGVDTFIAAARVIIPFEFPIIIAASIAARRGGPRWLILYGALAGNVGAGFLAAWLSYSGVVPSVTSGVGGGIVVIFFASTIFRWRLRYALAMILINSAIHIGYLLAWYQAGRTDWIEFAAGVVVLGMSACVGALVSYVLDRGSRAAFVNEMIIAEQRETIAAEKARADTLLAAILPETIAEALKESPGHIAEHFDEVTIVFSDIVGFTTLSESMTPDELVELLNDIVGRFDALAETIGIEKIKTIGDAYMAVAGLPEPCADHPHRAADFALGMLDCLADVNRDRDTKLELRIGIFTGPVVAGVIGTQKFAYDLWGDAVNTAARMESHGVAGAIQVGETTWAHLQDTHVLAERGPVDIKGKGEMQTWLLEGRLD